MDDNFLNRKEVPTQSQIIRYFFNSDEVDNMMNSMNSIDKGMSNVPPDMSKLGEPDSVEVAIGSEWEIFKLRWTTEEGPKYMILLKKTNALLDNFNFPNIPSYNKDFTTNISNDFELNNPLFNYNTGIEDIDYEDVAPMTYKEKLDIALQNEDYKEAARLRDWNEGLKILLKRLKPLLNKAIDNADLNLIDEYYQKINIYRSKL